MRVLMLLGVMALTGWAGAAAGAGRMDLQTVPPPGYRLALTFTSSVPDDYYVVSGPAASYARYRVNDDLREALEGYSGRAAGPSSGEPVRVLVHLESVTTDYRELGAGLWPPPTGIRPAHFADWDGDQGGPSIPEKITKSVVLTLGVRVERPGRGTWDRALHASAVEEIDRDHWDRWAYNYDDVIHASIRNAVAEVDRVLREALK